MSSDPATTGRLREDVVCEHGTAMDVHCCGCHSGFLFDVMTCTCLHPKDEPMLQLHRCKICGTRWLLWPDDIHGGGWNLLDKYSKPGSCCDNAAMGDQIEHLRDIPLTAALPVVERAHPQEDWRLIDRVIREVSELPDRTSPDDWPEAMLVTEDELRCILAAALSVPASSQPEKNRDSR